MFLYVHTGIWLVIKIIQLFEIGGHWSKSLQETLALCSVRGVGIPGDDNRSFGGLVGVLQLQEFIQLVPFHWLWELLVVPTVLFTIEDLRRSWFLVWLLWFTVGVHELEGFIIPGVKDIHYIMLDPQGVKDVLHMLLLFSDLSTVVIQ